jgi:erythromycin esterase-like protein
MWRNREVLRFIAWLRAHNQGRPPASRAGFYGLDLYSLYRSAEAVVAYLGRVDPEQAQIAKRRYACFDHVADPQQYGYEAVSRLRPACADAAIRQLVELRRRGLEYLAKDGRELRDEQFFAERNAAVVLNAENYYRAMFGSRVSSWNLRDRHMHETLLALQNHLRAGGGRGRIVVWAHNSHLGDARATEMGARGELNLGHLVRESAGSRDCLLVGFTTYAGRVAAAHDWEGDVECMTVQPALEGSYEKAFHSSRLDRFFLPLAPLRPLRHEPLLERAIGVIYRPGTERQSHYFWADLPLQFDAIFHLDETAAVEPLDVDEALAAEDIGPGPLEG